ncbi:MAG: hypothetical protein QXX38_03110 [Candidatus Aenigmatarchaeota archaeon]
MAEYNYLENVRIDKEKIPEFLKSLVPPGNYYTKYYTKEKPQTDSPQTDPLVELLKKANRDLIYYEVLFLYGYPEYSKDKCRILAKYQGTSKRIILTIEDDGRIREEFIERKHAREIDMYASTRIKIFLKS